MKAQIHHLHKAIAKVAPIVGISGDIKDHLNVKLHFEGEATPAQIADAQAVIKAFDVTKKYDADPEAFFADLALSSFNDAEYMSIFRAVKIVDTGAKKKYLDNRIALSDSKRAELKKLCDEHCIDLPI
jgi:hypothetical protein